MMEPREVLCAATMRRSERGRKGIDGVEVEEEDVEEDDEGTEGVFRKKDLLALVANRLSLRWR
jgi:hypothetical protein